MTMLHKQRPKTFFVETVLCEICGKEIPLDDSWSFLVQMCTTGPEHIKVIQCDTRGAQHFGCTLEHATEAAVVCLQEHMPVHHENHVKARNGESDTYNPW